MANRLKKNRLLTFEIIILDLIISVSLAFLPLTNVFSYEYALVQGIFLSLIFGFQACKFECLRYSSKNKYGKGAFLTLLVAIPVITAIFSTKLGQNCPLVEGFQFYFVITIPSAVFGFSLGKLISCTFNKWNKSFFILIWTGILFLPIVEIYYHPQIFVFNPIFGFFQGTIYDEDISVTLKLISYRGIILLFSISVIFIASKLKDSGKVRKTIAFLFVAALFATFQIIKPTLGYSSTKSSIKSKLNGELKTEHFNIIYSSKISEKNIKNIALYHEYYYQELASILNDSISGKITSFVFNDNSEKRQMFGAGNADVAKPWLKQIYITREHYNSTLKHELAHVFSAKYGWSIFKVAYKFNPAMIEGFAMALENNFGNSDIDYIAANAIDADLSLNVESLFSGFNFFKQSSSISYVYAGSFIKYLITKYSAEQVKKVYSDLDFDKHFNKKLSELSIEYINYLRTLKLSSTVNAAQLYFKRKPIQSRVCVRYTANKLNTAWSLYNSGAYYKAEKMFGTIYSYSHYYSALLGETLSIKSQEEYFKAEKLLNNNKTMFDSTSYYFNYLTVLGDLQILNGELEFADSSYSLLKHLRPSQDYFNLSVQRLYFIRNKSETVRNYILGSYFDKFNIINEIDFGSDIYNVIPTMLNLAGKLQINYATFIEMYKNLSFDSTYSSAYSALKLSKYSVDHSDFNSAVFFAEKSLISNKRKEFRIIAEDNLKKVIWMKENYKTKFKKMQFAE